MDGAGVARWQTDQRRDGRQLRAHAETMTMASEDPSILRASKLDTTSLSDAMDRLGIAGQCLNIKPLDHRFRMTGRAFTILYGPSSKPSGTVGDYIDDVAPDSVIVLDNGGRRDRPRMRDI